MENITHALEMMGQGMLGIFVVLGAIALLVALMQRIEDAGALVLRTDELGDIEIKR